MKSKSLKVIIIIFILMIVLLCGIVVIYITTDIFKSKEVLFKKYMAQNFQNIYKVLDISEEEQIIDTLGKSDYTEITDGKLTYLENKRDEQEEYTIKEVGVIKNSEGTSYRQLKTSYIDTPIINMDLLQQNNTYGFRLSNLVKQFVSVENTAIPYLVSSMGYDGKYFSEKMKSVKLSGILNFSDEEIKTLSNSYLNIIFADISEKNYSSKKALITLNNDQSVETKAYTLTITKNDFDKMYKRLLNHAKSDTIILAKLEQIDEMFTEMGFSKLEEESLKEKYISKLETISKSIEYEGTDTTPIQIIVYEKRGITLRTSMKIEENEYNLDLNEYDINLEEVVANSISFKSSTIVDKINEIKIFSFSKIKDEIENTRKIKYQEADKEWELDINEVNKENGINLITNIKYTDDKIENLSLNTDTDITFQVKQNIPEKFNNKNNILLNNYDGEKIASILDSLRKKTIKSLEDTQSKINTKLLNKIVLYADEKEKQKEDERNANIELQKKRFNNQFSIYEGEDIEAEYVAKLLKIAGQNMKGYEVINGGKIKLLIEKDSQNEDKANEILEVISDRYTYNVSVQYSLRNIVNAVEISVYKK